MIMLGRLNLTATQSRMNTAPKGGRDGGTEKALSSFISRIIRVLEPIGLFWKHYTQLIGMLSSEYSLVEVCV